MAQLLPLIREPGGGRSHQRTCVIALNRSEMKSVLHLSTACSTRGRHTSIKSLPVGGTLRSSFRLSEDSLPFSFFLFFPFQDIARSFTLTTYRLDRFYIALYVRSLYLFFYVIIFLSVTGACRARLRANFATCDILRFILFTYSRITK